jgi:hypothetical protein
MKNFLYGTTALATAGLIAGIAGNASAAERIKIGVHGYHQQWLTAVDQDFDDNSGNPTKSTNVVDQKHNSEICFIGETTLDNGITFGLNVQLEANTEGDQIDESYMYVQSDSLGKLILGDENNAGYLLHVTAPNGGVSMDSGDFTNNNMFENPISGCYDSALCTTNLRFGDNDSGKATYISPRFAGIQLGVSYIPQFEPGGDSNSTVRVANNQVNNGWAGGINYTEDFNGFGVKLSGGYLYGDTAADSVTSSDDDLQAYNLGAQFSYAGFALGGAFAKGIEGGGARRINSDGWIVGAAYKVGPYNMGINYMKGEGNPTTGGGKQRLQQLAVSGAYQLGPGIRLVGALFQFDAQSEDQRVSPDPDTGAGGGSENDGWGATIGFKLGF